MMGRLGVSLVLGFLIFFSWPNASRAAEAYVPDVVGQFAAISDRAEAIGIKIGDSDNPDTCRHYQAMARSTAPGTPYFFLAKSGNKPEDVPACLAICEVGGVPIPCTSVGDDVGRLMVVRMGSRDTNGERLRSNRMARNTETEDSAPPEEDVIVKEILFDGQNGWPHYGHPGSLQLVGNVLAVALETPYAPETRAHLILFVDVSDPENPVPKATFQPDPDVETGTLGVAREPDGRFLLLSTGKDNSVLKVYRSQGTDLTEQMTWDFVDDWTAVGLGSTEDEIYLGGLWPVGGGITLRGAHQLLNFVREGGPDGQLYVIGAHDTNGGLPFGDDIFSLYRVDWVNGEFKLFQAGQRHVQCTSSSDGATLLHERLSSFAAATAVYVSPSGELILYGTEHDNDGPAGSIKAAEFRHRFMTRDNSPSLNPTVRPGGPYVVPEGGTVPLAATAEGPATKAWVQLWEDDERGGRYLVIDYPDRSKDDFDDFEDLDDAKNDPLDDGFGDQASSMAWFTPDGCTIRMNQSQTESGGAPGLQLALTYPGSDTFGYHGDLDDVDFDDSSTETEDRFSSVTFEPDCDDYYSRPMDVAWDTDGNGSFDTSGASATFSALLLDGPSQQGVTARAEHPTDHRIGTATSQVEVFNVDPALASLELRDPSGRVLGTQVPFLVAALPATLDATFTDAGRPDTHVADVAWGDGASTSQAGLAHFSDSTGGVVGAFGAVHRFVGAGSFTVVATVTDDDAGVGNAQQAVEVVGPKEVMQAVVEEIAELLAGATDSRIASALQRAMVHLLAAQQRLDSGALQSAMAQLVAAIVALEEAESFGGPDVSGLTGLIALAGYSIAQTTYDGAVAANPNPSVGTARRLARSAAALATGAQEVAQPDDLSAIRAFQESVSHAQAARGNGASNFQRNGATVGPTRRVVTPVR